MNRVVHNASRYGDERDFADRASGGATSNLELTETDRATGDSFRKKPYERRVAS